jgi:hypothetical protein
MNAPALVDDDEPTSWVIEFSRMPSCRGRTRQCRMGAGHGATMPCHCNAAAGREPGTESRAIAILRHMRLSTMRQSFVL